MPKNSLLPIDATLEMGHNKDNKTNTPEPSQMTSVTITCPIKKSKGEVLTGECNMIADEAGLYRVYMDDHSIFFASADEIKAKPEDVQTITVSLNDIEFQIPAMPTWLDLHTCKDILRDTCITGSYARKDYRQFLGRFGISIPRNYSNRSARALMLAFSQLPACNVA
jgi:hypothetical protein